MRCPQTRAAKWTSRNEHFSRGRCHRREEMLSATDQSLVTFRVVSVFRGFRFSCNQSGPRLEIKPNHETHEPHERTLNKKAAGVSCSLCFVVVSPFRLSFSRSRLTFKPKHESTNRTKSY